MNSDVNHLQRCCVNITSSKVTERKKNAEELFSLIENERVVEFLNKNENDRVSWDSIVRSIHSYLVKEADKLLEDENKKAAPVNKKPVHEILNTAIYTANRGAIRLDVKCLIEFVLDCFNRRSLTKYFSHQYLVILRDFILSRPHYYGRIDHQSWLDLLDLLKTFLKENLQDNIKATHCLQLLVKWGPINQLPIVRLRNEFPFITQLSLQLNCSSTKSQQEEVLRILLEFCNQNAKDSWMACCKLGEDVFPKLQLFYEKQTNDTIIKDLLFEFYLLQVKLHHPKGITEGNPSAYAYSWPKWNSQMRTIFFVVQQEFSNSEGVGYKLNHLFNSSNTGKSSTFTMLAVEIFKQIFSCGITNMTQISLNISNETEQPKKRQRVEVGISTVILKIQDNKSWQWIYSISELLVKYPELINEGDFIQLLQIISTLQLESKDPNVQRHVYKCLHVLIDVEKHFGEIYEVKTIWSLVWDSALRSAGLNQNMQVTHDLIQKLILERKTQNCFQIFQTYTSGVLTPNKYSLKTLNVAAQYCSMPDVINKLSSRNAILNWILNNDNEKYQNFDFYSEEVTAQVLIFLCLKQWPSNQFKTKSKDVSFDNFEDIYLINSFQSELIIQEDEARTQENNLNCGFNDLTDQLILKLQTLNLQFVDVNDEMFAKNLLNIVILNANLLSFMVKYNVINNETFEETIVKLHLKKLFLVMSDIFLKCSNQKSVIENKLVLIFIQRCADLLKICINPFVSAKIRELIPTELLKSFFELLNFEEDNEDNDQNDQIIKLKLSCMNALCNFCFVQGSDNLSDLQIHALNVLAKPDFNADNTTEYKMALIFLFSLKKCTPGILHDDMLTMILDSLLNICQARYTDYETVLNILIILKDFYNHVALSNCDIVKSRSVMALKKIYILKDNYGPKVSSLILECIGQIFKLDPGGSWSKWSDEHIAFYIPEFLTINYQEVRLAAVKNLSEVFKVTFSDKNLLHKIQKTIFNKIKIKSLEVFDIEGEISAERMTDETVTRTASVLHTFGTIMAVNSAWRKMSLFNIIHIVQDKKLNIDLLDTLLNIVAKYLGIKNSVTFLEPYVEYLLNKWHSKKFLLSDFPYNLVGCSSDMDFFNKYLNIIVPLLIESNDLNMLNKISQYVGKSISDLTEFSFSKITAKCFLKMSSNSTATEKHKCGKNIYESLNVNLTTNKIEELLMKNIDQVLIEMIQSIIDLTIFKEQFDIDYELVIEDEYFRSVNYLKEAFNFIQDTLKIRCSIIEHCLSTLPDKIQNIALNLSLKMHLISGIQAKLEAIHHYAIFVDILTPHLKQKNIKEFLVRDILHTLLNLIDVNNGEDLLNVAIVKYLNVFLMNILPQCADILENFLIVVVNKLIPIVQSENQLSKSCLKLLQFLIIDNATNFQQSIESLDPFPQDDNFKEINEVYLKVKYRNKSYSLKDEIDHFLRAGNLAGNVGCRTEALRHLKTQLTVKKTEINNIYKELDSLRGFSEDCKSSILHQLISTLLQLVSSPDPNVRLEATRCLGELGPADLTTIILQMKNTTTDNGSNPLLFLTSQIITLLYQYIVDSDIRVVEVTSKVLYKILDTKEGKQFIEHCEENQLNKAYLMPFLTKRKIRSDSHIEIDIQMFLVNVNEDELWWSTGEHTQWIINLVCKILECFSEKSYLKQLIPICKVKIEFAEQIFPYLIYIVLYQNIPQCNNVISEQMEKYFDKVWMLTARSKHDDKIQKASIRCMLDVVHFVRLQRSVSNNKNLGHLSLNYLKVAQAAYYCSVYFATLLYVELWCQMTITKLRNSDKCPNNALTMLDVICENENKDVCAILCHILRQTYSALGDFDALYGCGFTHLLDTKSRVDHYKQLEKWDQVVLHYDIQVGHSTDENRLELMNALKNCSLYQLASNYNEGNNEPDYECFWRLNQYNNNNYKLQQNCPNTYEKYRYESLKSLIENDGVLFMEAVDKARMVLIDSIKNRSFEGVKYVYNYLTHLQSIQELEDLNEAKQKNNFVGVLNKWQEQDSIGRCDFKYIEPVKAQRIAVLTGLVKSGIKELNTPLVQMYLDLSEISRSAGYFNVSKRAVGNLSLLSDMPVEFDGLKMFEEAQICWSMNDKSTARYIIRHLLNTNKENTRLYFASLILYGKWMAESCSENPQTILTNYFLKSLKVMGEIEKTSKDYEDIFETYDILARFVDTEYQRILAYIKSSEFERKVQNMEKSRTAALKIKDQSGPRPNEDERKAICTYQKQSMIDQTEIENTFKEKNTYFILAMKYYMLNLQYSDSNNVRIFRIISLWLDNRTSSDLPKLLKENILKIASYKYLSILPQLVPHLSNSNEELFGSFIYSIIEHCAKDHPHHTLPILLALANSNKDDGHCKITTRTESNEPRVVGAVRLINKLKEDRHLKKIVNQMELISEALIQLAYIDHNKCTETKLGFDIPAQAKIHKIKNFDNMLLPTHTLPVQKNKDYNNIIGIHSFNKKFANVGGINAPKRIICKGTDGLDRTQLLKGKDDLRQDAVMQQVFTIMNGLLQSNKQTTKLLIRTYKVVPLSKRSGIIEWVENSVPLGEYLVNAHNQYNNGDWSVKKCKNEFMNTKPTNEDKLKKFVDICKNFHPVMHKFFETNFLEPIIWYERRRAYMHSVATSSMCGYILGLGDRHVQNILIDKTTAEVIHIDFGIAFEQGRVLPTPETVPFRLTRDIEDGMGVSGIEGVFRRSCEKTMEVLRLNSETIITILEVLLYDPLYAWTVTPAEAYSRQFSADRDQSSDSINFSDEDKIPVNVTAERALLRLRQKLHGTEEGGTSSIEGQVEKLLQQARDYANLSRLYHGWQPFL